MAKETFTIDDFGGIENKKKFGVRTFEDNQENEDNSPEVFKSVYIAGKAYDLEEKFWKKVGNKVEKRQIPGFLQIRGYAHNLDTVYMSISTVKYVFVNEKESKINSDDSIKKKGNFFPKCFSYKIENEDGRYVGTSGRLCPETTTERREEEYCNNCREHIIVSGFLTDEKGTFQREVDPSTGKEVPVSAFIRARGWKYGPVNEYLSSIKNMKGIDFILPDSAKDLEMQEFEKSYIWPKRIITKVTVDMVDTKYGPVNVFIFERVGDLLLSPSIVKNLESWTKRREPDFNKKFDWTEPMIKIEKKKKSSQGPGTKSSSQRKMEAVEDFPETHDIPDPDFMSDDVVENDSEKWSE